MADRQPPTANRQPTTDFNGDVRPAELGGYGAGFALLVGYLGWLVLQLGPAIPSIPLKVAALAYLPVHCASTSGR